VLVQSLIARRYCALGPLEQRVFRALAVFRGEFSHAAAAAVCLEDPAAVVAACDVLVREGLVRCRPDGGAARMHLATMTRDIALELLDEAGEYELARERHTDWSAGFAAALAPRLTRDDSDAAVARLAAEWVNLEDAVDWLLERGDCEGVVRLLHDLWPFLQRDGRRDTARQWLEAIPAPCEHMSAAAQAQYVWMTEHLPTADPAVTPT
jgi:predicted ATPase